MPKLQVLQKVLKKVILFVGFYFLCHDVVAQPAEYKMTRKEYIERFKDDAIKEMLVHGVPASITLAQGMLESGNGNSALAVYANNHFGIKCHLDWAGPTYIQDDDERDECFRKYPTVLESYSDHSLFLKSRSWYGFLFDLKTTDYRAWAKGLKDAGYATDPSYSYKLIQIIEENKLYDCDVVKPLPNIKPEVKKNNSAISSTVRKVMLFNDIKYVMVKEGDTYSSIAKEFGTREKRLYRYNDLVKNDKLIAGQKLYLQPKRRNAKEEFHIVQRGETMKSIAQLHGIKIKHLYKKNRMKAGDQPKPGTKLFLRKRKVV